MQRYSVQEKRKAIALANKLGPVQAGRQLGIPDGTLSCWSFKARKAKREGRQWPAATAKRRSEGPRTGVRRSKAASPGTAGAEPADVESKRDVGILETWRERSGPRLVAAEVHAEPVERDLSLDVAWELETERGTVLRVRRTISPPELERVLAAITAEGPSR